MSSSPSPRRRRRRAAGCGRARACAARRRSRSDENVTWRPVFSSPRMAPLDQPGDDRAVAEGALHQRGFREPRVEIVAQHVLVEQLVERQSPCAMQRQVAAAPRSPAHIRWRRSRAAAAARARAAASAACRASGARAGPRTDSRRDSAARRAETSRPASRSRRGSSERHCAASRASRAPGRAARSQASGSASISRTRSARIGRERKLAALVGRDLRIRSLPRA